MKVYEFKEHTADFCIEVKADTLEGLFEAAAEGLLNNIFNDIKLGKKTEKVSFKVESESKEELLVKFLNELLYMFYIRKVLLKDSFCHINFGVGVLIVQADFTQVENFSANFEIKSVTYGNLEIKHKNNLYETTVIADV